MAKSKASANPLMDAIVAVCKRRGFIFQSSEIYGGYNGFFDFGPLGVELKKNIKDAWWKDMVHRREDIEGLDSSIIMSPKIWVASGHVGGFSDPMVDCKVSKMRYRADQLFFAPVIVDGEKIGYVSILEDGNMQADAEAAADKMKRKGGHQGELAPIELKEYTEATEEEWALIPSPATGEPGSLTAPREFNLMFETKVGALSDSSATAYLRPETAQGIFANYKNVVDTGRVKIPFGIAQIGKAFRNEITPKNFIFRSREFEQMEIEYFVSPDCDWSQIHQEWIQYCHNWLLSIGLPEEMLGRDVHEKLAHYAKACTDITFQFPFGEQELWGIAARGDFDLTQHAEHSGKPMEIFDEAAKKKYIPHVIEPSLGVDRLLLALLTAAYTEDEVGGEKRTVMKFHPRIAPYKVAVLPLLKNKPELVERARAIFDKLAKRYNVFWDTAGAIGKRYRRQDEAGTPYCVTIDFDTIEKDGSVTLRDRDTTEQKRVSEEELYQFLDEQLF
ncbi:glycine--tRNA ligase [Pelagicoccus enzymogenes]|uniref:glycine--tRNA ligase n=1 Tax=Pelagicoccus enzymogenes TaxID=2773457 RepID=UPI00280C9753|nr:glycine--tRNA ligase [Pelagicoccus enzymogenes]MDQ8199088.1 glycine--tRNA ligase [Pelagicoccus enzymogenes]